MIWTGRTRRRRTARLEVQDRAGNVFALAALVTEHERESPRGDGTSSWKKRFVDYELSNGRRVILLNYDTFKDPVDGTLYATVRRP